MLGSELFQSNLYVFRSFVFKVAQNIISMVNLCAFGPQGYSIELKLLVLVSL